MQDALADSIQPCRRLQIRNQQNELVAALAADGVGITNAGLQARDQLLQHRITGGVAECVINDFEMVEIEKQQGDAAATPVGHCFGLQKPIAQ